MFHFYLGKEIVMMDFDQTLDFVNSIEFSDDTKPKVETKEGVLRIKDNKIDAPELKLDIKQEVKKSPVFLWLRI